MALILNAELTRITQLLELQAAEHKEAIEVYLEDLKRKPLHAILTVTLDRHGDIIVSGSGSINAELAQKMVCAAAAIVETQL